MKPLAERLELAIQAASIAVIGVSIGTPGIKATYRVAPANLQAAAQPTIDAFDDSAAADATYEAARAPERKDLRDQAVQAIADLDTYLALTTPTNAKNVAQIRQLAQMMRAVIKRLVQIA